MKPDNKYKFLAGTLVILLLAFCACVKETPAETPPEDPPIVEPDASPGIEPEAPIVEPETVPVDAPAKRPNVTEDGFEYEINPDGTCTITGFELNKSMGGDLVIPDEINGSVVTKIGDAAFSHCVEFIVGELNGRKNKK